MEENGARKIVLENGLEFYGEGFGAPCDAIHEIVFNTSMVGYQEIISDPSYTGQMIVMTYPLIGNYGITDEDFESRLPALGGLIVREYSDDPSNFRWTKTLGEILRENGVPGVCGVDTRRITRIIRAEGSQKAMITSAGTPLGDALAALERYSLPRDLVRRVCSKTRWYSRTANPLFNVAAVDCGMKLNIVRSFNRLGCNVTVVPCDVTPGELEALRPDGLFISNGPGDPQDVPEVAELIRAMRGRMPIFGICLGCQLIGLAYGAKTYKMKFGHRGGNHPVVDLTTGRLEITSQNHSYAIDAASLEGTGLVMTHRNLLDDTAEGVTCLSDAVMAVQYHPESAPGPQDSGHLFERFISLMARARKR